MRLLLLTVLPASVPHSDGFWGLALLAAFMVTWSNVVPRWQFAATSPPSTSKDPALEGFDPDMVEEFQRLVLDPYEKQLMEALRKYATSPPAAKADVWRRPG